MNLATPYRARQTEQPRRRSTLPRQARRQGTLMVPRVLLHVVVGVLTLTTAQALFRSADGSPQRLAATSVVYAEQPVAEAASVSAPALSSGRADASTTTQPVQVQPGQSTVMTDFSATIGRTTAPATTSWYGVAGQDVNRRAEPNRSRPPVGDLKAGAPAEVVRWVSGEEVEPHNNTWAELSDGTYVFSTALRRSGAAEAPALPADAPTSGRWIDVNLTEQVATAYEGRTAVRSVLISSGRPGWETPTGTFTVLRRLEKDTMDGSTLVGQGPDGAGADYKVEDVRYVQYFTNDGAALHENYWRRPATFGMPGSHGCVGLTPADAAWFWNFATVGTPLVIHE